MILCLIRTQQRDFTRNMNQKRFLDGKERNKKKRNFCSTRNFPPFDLESFFSLSCLLFYIILQRNTTTLNIKCDSDDMNKPEKVTNWNKVRYWPPRIRKEFPTCLFIEFKIKFCLLRLKQAENVIRFSKKWSKSAHWNYFSVNFIIFAMPGNFLVLD